MGLWQRLRRRLGGGSGRGDTGRGEWLAPNPVPDYDGGWNLGSVPPALEPKVNPQKTRIYSDEVDPDWEDPLTAEDPDDDA